jgi:adenylate cyclase
MESLAAYLPVDRRRALARGQELPRRTEGTALFADISGFTPLTETLLKTLGPRLGAEELSRHLNVVYDAIIAEVDRYGGTVLGFAGDAITCWFEGQAAQRAATCALAMQAALKPYAALTLSTGAPLALAMKVALATGPASRMVVGEPGIQRLDVLAGATLERMAAAEHHAKAGEVVAEESTLGKLGESVTLARQETDGGRRYALVSRLHRRARQRSWPPDDAALTVEMASQWLLPPVAARLVNGEARFLAEIRTIVALFMSFGGIDYDADPRAADKLDAYFRAVQQVLRRYDAYALQLTMGDKGCYLYAAFGAPVAHDDDPLRAVAAALDLHDLSGRFDAIRNVGIGLNEGSAWCGAYGGPTRHTYGVLGEAVNVAARLMGRAKTGETLLGPLVAQAVKKHYVLEDQGELDLKGVSSRVRVWKVMRPLAASIGTATYRLVGRQQELSRLTEVWNEARSGAGRVVRLTGPAGVGKSHLAQTLAEAAGDAGALVAMGLCHGSDQIIAYKPWRPILLRLLGLADEAEPKVQQAQRAEAALEGLDPAWKLRAPLLGDVLDLPLSDNPTTAAFDPALRREAISALVVDVVRAAAGRSPLLLWLDNVHAADEASGALALAVGRAIEHSAALLMCTQRPLSPGAHDPLAEAALPSFVELPLPPLADADIAALAEERLGGAVRPLALSLLQKQAQGNPFYLDELMRAMREMKLLIKRDDGDWFLSQPLFDLLQDQHCLMRRTEDSPWVVSPDAVFSGETLGLPGSLQRTIAARLDQLAPEAQMTVKTASVIGPRFETEVLVLAHPRYPGRVALEAQLRELEQRRLAHAAEASEPPVFVFEHNLIQEGIYDSLVSDQRNRLHAAVGAALKEVRPEAVEQLAYHFSRAGNREQALEYLGRAADRARHSYANETALKYYEQALAVEPRWEWRKAQVEVLGIQGRRAEQKSALQALEAMAGTPPFEAAFLWGQYYETICDYPHAEEALERARTIARERFHRAHEAASLIQLGLIAYRCGQYAPAENWFEQAQGLFPPRPNYPAEEARLLAQAANGVGLAKLYMGSLAECGTHFQRALELYHSAGDLRGEAQALSNLGLAAYKDHQFGGALGFHRQALGLRKTIGDRAGQGSSLLNLAMTARDSGDYGQAESWLQSALQIQRETGNRWDEVNTWSELGILHQELGNLREAQACLQNGLELSIAIGDEAGQAYVRSNLGLALCDQGDFDAAGATWQSGLDLAQAQQDKRLEAAFLSYLGELGRLTGQPTRAVDYSGRARDLRQMSGLDVLAIDDLCTLALVKLDLGDAVGARACAGQAWAALQACQGDGPEFPQRAYWACYRVLEAAGQEVEARTALQAAYDWVMARAGRIVDAALRHSFLENAPRNHQVMEAARRVLNVPDP